MDGNTDFCILSDGMICDQVLLVLREEVFQDLVSEGLKFSEYKS